MKARRVQNMVTRRELPWSMAAVALALAVAALGCGGASSPPADATGPLRVVATTTVVGDLARTIAGPDAEVEVLMGPGIDPHLYKASAGDVRRMSSAGLIVYNGLELEGKMGEVLANMDRRGVRTVAVAECLPVERLIPLEGFAELYDPHLWFDVALWAMTVPCVESALVEVDPANAAGYRRRAAAYVDDLGTLDTWVRERLAAVPPERRVLVTAHDAFSYFGRAYAFEVRGLLGISTTVEAGTADVTELADFIVNRRLPAVFVETSVPRRYVQALQEAVAARGFTVAIGGSLYSDSLGDPETPAGSYPGTVRANVDTIVGALAAGVGDPEGG